MNVNDCNALARAREEQERFRREALAPLWRVRAADTIEDLDDGTVAFDSGWIEFSPSLAQCQTCGAQVDAGAAFCPNCGELDPVDPS